LLVVKSDKGMCCR